METETDFFIFLSSQITADGDCSHEIKRSLLLGRKALTNLDSILKSRDLTLPTKVHLVKAMFFPVVMCGCESWIIKKAEHQRIDAFELWCWRRLLRVPWISRRSNQSILKEMSLEYSLEGLMLKLKLQYFGHLMWRVDSLEKTDAGRDWGQEEKGTTEDEIAGWHHWVDGRESGWTLGVGDGQGGLVCCDSWGRKESDRTEILNWTVTILSGGSSFKRTYIKQKIIQSHWKQSKQKSYLCLRSVAPFHVAYLVVQMIKNLPAMPETQVRSLSWDDPQEKGMATHSNNLAWRIPWTKMPGRL